MSKPTIALQMIVKDEYDKLNILVTEATDHFDEINLTVSDKATAKKMTEAFKHPFIAGGKVPNVHVQYRPWTDNFADARNANLDMCTSDYFFWMDADDTFDFNAINSLVDLAEKEKYDLIYLPYEYARDEDNNVVALHWRERLVRTGAGFEWRGAVHETLLRDAPFRGKRVEEPAVVHHNDHTLESKMRNHKILLKQVEGKATEDTDPRDLYYLGISFFGMGQLKEAIDVLREYVKVGGWDEEIYRAYVKISECYFMLGDLSEAVQYALRAAYTLPHYQEAYLTLARYDYAQERWKECLNWLEVAFSKPETQTMSVQNPQGLEYAKLQAATCYFQLRQFVKAYKYLQLAPKYLTADVEEDFKREANIETFTEIVPQIIETGFVDKAGIYESLITPLKFDPRLRWLRNDVVKPVEWDKDTVVFFCGKAFEEWGAHTLDKGMGGSEEAVVYLSRELAKLGKHVTIYGDVAEEYVDEVSWTTPTKQLHSNGILNTNVVRYKPWQQFDVRDKFATVVVWRAPQYAAKLNADKIIIDIHDVLPEANVPVFENALYFAKSKFHRTTMAHVPDDQIRIIGNGIVAKQFEGDKTKKPHSVGYFSAYYRGLECLLRMWPQIREAVPDATLDIYYGWQSWTAFQGEDEFYERVSEMIEDLEDQGVTEHGRVSHEELAKAMNETQVWAYPTEFAETHCITALKAQEALAYPVTTDVAALAETVQSGEKFETSIIYTNEYDQAKFIKAVVSALKEGKLGTPVPNVDWSDVAQQWLNVIEEK
jgi:tetratricopeptide (TPR) repeat protein